MNPDCTRTAPLGIEVEFQPTDLTLVAHIPSRDGGAIYFINGRDDLATFDPRPFDRAILRALLTEGLRALDASEPAVTTGAAR